MTVVHPSLKKFLTDLDKRELAIDDLLLYDRSVYLTLGRHGLIFPYGDTFAYDGKAVYVCGASRVGKSALMKRFKERLGERVTILTEDGPVIYLDKNSNPVTYDGSFDIFDDPPSSLPVLSPEKNTPYILDTIIYLNPSGKRTIIPYKKVSGEVRGYLIESNGQRRTRALERRVVAAMSQVHIFGYRKNFGYTDDADLEQTYQDIVSEIDNVRKK